MSRCAIVAMLIVAFAGAARAGGDVPPLARQLSDRGRALHDLGDYEQAIVAYKQAYLIAPSPGLLFNMAQAYRLEGDCAEAADFYRRYLQTDPDPQARRIAEIQLATVSACARRAEAGARPALAITHTAPPPDDAPGRGKRRFGMIATGAGALLLAGGTYYALDARDASDQVGAAYARGGTWKSIAELDARGQRSSELATGLLIGGGAAVATGVVFYLLGRHEDLEHAPVMTIAPGAQGGASVGASWRF
jgi:tetratricopeptide (TPR) repeat protein